MRHGKSCCAGGIRGRDWITSQRKGSAAHTGSGRRLAAGPLPRCGALAAAYSSCTFPVVGSLQQLQPTAAAPAAPFLPCQGKNNLTCSAAPLTLVSSLSARLRRLVSAVSWAAAASLISSLVSASSVKAVSLTCCRVDTSAPNVAVRLARVTAGRASR